MKIKKMLIVLAGIVLIAFLWIYLQFLGSHKIEKEKEMEAEAISVMAPYEVKQYQTVLKEIGEAYSQKSGNKKIEFEFIPEENIKKELLLRNLNKKNEVDMVICANTLMPELIRMGFFQELSVDQNTHQRVRQQTLWNSVKENGKIYGIPFTCDPYVLFYRKDRMEEKNLKCPETWDEFEKCGKSMQKLGIKSIGIPGRREDDFSCIFRIMLYSSGGNFLSMDQEAGIQTFERIQRMVRQNLIDREMINYTPKDLAVEFAEGKINMMINQMSMSALLRESDAASEIGVSRLPDDVAGSGFLYGENVGIMQDADPQTEEFLAFLIRKENSEKIINEMGILSPFSDVTYTNTGKIYLENREEIFEDAKTMEMYATWTRMSEDIAQGMYEIIEEYRADPKETAREVHDKVRISIMEG